MIWKKPRFKLSEWRTVLPFLDAMRADALRLSATDIHSVRSIASDVLDSWAVDAEVLPLVRKGILEVIPDRACEHAPCLNCGTLANCHTWHLTNRGIALVYPEYILIYPERLSARKGAVHV